MYGQAEFEAPPEANTVAKKRREEKEQGGKNGAAGECKEGPEAGRDGVRVRGRLSMKCVGLMVELWNWWRQSQVGRRSRSRR